jgi:hypothetical protein
MREQLHQSRIISLVWQALLECPIAFERIANGNGDIGFWAADRMPESWVLAHLMQAACQEGYAAFPEARGEDDLKECVTSSGYIECPGQYRGKRLDLVIGQIEPDQGDTFMRVYAAIELKAPKSKWQDFRKDLERLRALRSCAPNELLIFAYVCGPKTDAEFVKEQQLFEVETGVTKEQYEVRPCEQPSVRPECNAYSRVFLVFV